MKLIREKSQPFLDKHKKDTTDQTRPSNQCGKNAETSIAFYQLLPTPRNPFCPIDFELPFVALHTELPQAPSHGNSRSRTQPAPAPLPPEVRGTSQRWPERKQSAAEPSGARSWALGTGSAPNPRLLHAPKVPAADILQWKTGSSPQHARDTP